MSVSLPDGYDLTDPDIYAEKVPLEDSPGSADQRRCSGTHKLSRPRASMTAGLGAFASRRRQGGVVCSRGVVERGEHRHREVRRRNRRLSGPRDSKAHDAEHGRAATPEVRGVVSGARLSPRAVARLESAPSERTR